MSTSKITIEANISATPETVWNAYTDPKHITQWNFASPEWCCPSASNDLQVGGKYEARMEAKDGSFGFDLIGFYDAIEPGVLLDYHLEDGRKVITRFESISEGVKVTTVFDAESENPIEMQQQGWQAILNNFKAHVEGKSIV